MKSDWIETAVHWTLGDCRIITEELGRKRRFALYRGRKRHLVDDHQWDHLVASGKKLVLDGGRSLDKFEVGDEVLVVLRDGLVDGKLIKIHPDSSIEILNGFPQVVKLEDVITFRKPQPHEINK